MARTAFVPLKGEQMNTPRTKRETVTADWTSGELGGRAALVTGGGIGAAICIALAEQGACIAAD